MNQHNFPKIDVLCETYHYPDPVRKLLHKILNIFAPLYPHSVILSGSASRGELIYTISSCGEVFFYSDLEFYVLVKKINPTQIKLIRNKLHSLQQQQWQKGASTFHIDVSFIHYKKWAQYQNSFQMWETNQTGRILWGDNILKPGSGLIHLPAVYQSCLNRMWYLLLYMDKSILQQQPTSNGLQSFAYATSRAVLDFPIWLLCKNNIFIPTFSARYEYILQHPDKLQQWGLNGDKILALLQNAVHLRCSLKNIQKRIDFKEVMRMYHDLFKMYYEILLWTCPDSNFHHSFCEIIRKNSHHLYPALTLRRYIRESQQACHFLKQSSLRKSLKWLSTNKQVCITCFLWHMHQASGYYWRGLNEEAELELYSATMLLNKLWPGRQTFQYSDSFLVSWKKLRIHFFDFLPRFYQGLLSNIPYYRFLLSDRSIKKALPSGTGKAIFIKIQ